MRPAKQLQNAQRSRVTRVFRHCVIAVLLTALVSACATTGGAAHSDIKQRAQARWDALLKGDYGTAYGFYSPGYRSGHSLADFEFAMRTQRVRWVSAEVKETSCKADACKVKTHVGYSVSGALPGVPVWKSKQDINENWVHTEGQWWFLPNQ